MKIKQICANKVLNAWMHTTFSMNHPSILSVHSYIEKPKSHSPYIYISWCWCSCMSLPVSPDSSHRSSCYAARYLINYPIILSVQSYIEKPKSHSPYFPRKRHGVWFYFFVCDHLVDLTWNNPVAHFILAVRSSAHENVHYVAYSCLGKYIIQLIL